MYPQKPFSNAVIAFNNLNTFSLGSCDLSSKYQNITRNVTLTCILIIIVLQSHLPDYDSERDLVMTQEEEFLQTKESIIKEILLSSKTTPYVS